MLKHLLNDIYLNLVMIYLLMTECEKLLVSTEWLDDSVLFYIASIIQLIIIDCISAQVCFKTEFSKNNII